MESAHKGSSVIFASYITAIARVNLMRGIHICAKIFGQQSVCYTDTDSIYIYGIAAYKRTDPKSEITIS